MIVINEYLAIAYNVPQQCGILTRIDSDKPVQPPNKLKNTKFCSVSSLTVSSEALLVAYTTLLEISCRSSYTLLLHTY